jgi:ribosomal protein S18 acetylase RimI-like enzyme
MLERMYDIDSLLQQQRDGHLFYLLSDNDCLVGFISIKQESDQDWFLNKLYIDTHRQGSGLGAFALDEILKLHEMQVLRLQVNRQNFKAINFYFKKGFTIERVADFEIGQGYFMNDFIMIWRKPQA